MRTDKTTLGAAEENFFDLNDSPTMRSEKVYGESHMKLDGVMETPRDRREEAAQEKKKNNVYKELYEQFYRDLLFQIDVKLEAVQLEMEQNRKEWETRANRLDAIDDVLEPVKDGKPLDKEKAQHIINSTGRYIAPDADNAAYYNLLVAIKTEDLEQIEVLDRDFRKLEQQEQQYKMMQQQAQDIANDTSLDSHQKLAAYENLNNEMSKADLIIVSRDTENQEQKSDAEVVAKHDFENQRSDLTYDVSRLNF
ncbi:hypothetical protein DVK85_01580 [Flavobacterium arcticum]|uniref:Uncharacterized protein n=1 Tax=Flavobacterium arcticum TaxID=1784713 RepID=A0A345H8T3_9FLAO|nr:hypothetical protein [Flavobacterium arcticum]AXG72993.1 hypothetical protein DVK85_01580 [Flavobacterium arcticum]KAF2510343.1 hypothetical protein E0W72_07625 [Flavobacterium arcticum]